MAFAPMFNVFENTVFTPIGGGGGARPSAQTATITANALAVKHYPRFVYCDLFLLRTQHRIPSDVIHVIFPMEKKK